MTRCFFGTVMWIFAGFTLLSPFGPAKCVIRTTFDAYPELELEQSKQGRQDLNLQPPVLETGALPIELRPSVAAPSVSAPCLVGFHPSA